MRAYIDPCLLCIPLSNSLLRFGIAWSLSLSVRFIFSPPAFLSLSLSCASCMRTCTWYQSCVFQVLPHLPSLCLVRHAGHDSLHPPPSLFCVLQQGDDDTVGVCCGSHTYDLHHRRTARYRCRPLHYVYKGCISSSSLTWLVSETAEDFDATGARCQGIS